MMRNPYSFSLTALAAGLLLAGCAAMGPDYQRPALDVPATLGSTNTAASAAKGTAVDWLAWWKSFQDPTLNALLDEAAANSQDLVLAAGRVEEARALYGGAHAGLFPTVDANASVAKSHLSVDAGTIPPGTYPIVNDYKLGLTASYELDFWGKLRRADEAARSRLLSAQASRGTVQATLYANVAQNYFTLRAFDAQLALAEATLATRRDNLRLQQKRLTAGVIGELDFHQAEAEAAATDVVVLQARQALRNSESAIALLLGRSPAQIANPVIARGQSIDTLQKSALLPADLPSDLLNRRPDLVAAERQLVAANADIGQAKAAYFPTLKLTAGAGDESLSLSKLFSAGSRFWNMGLGLTQPVFRAGALDAVVAGAEARKQQALAQYVQAVQAAFRDVHDALVNIAANQDVVEATAKRIAAVQDTKRLADLRYANGYSSQLEVLNAQRDLLQAQSGLIEAKRAQLAALVALYKAVGGGWDGTNADKVSMK
jgi:multidrug efflux system outer membrane protein